MLDLQFLNQTKQQTNPIQSLNHTNNNKHNSHPNLNKLKISLVNRAHPQILTNSKYPNRSTTTTPTISSSLSQPQPLTDSQPHPPPLISTSFTTRNPHQSWSGSSSSLFLSSLMIGIGLNDKGEEKREVEERLNTSWERERI